LIALAVVGAATVYLQAQGDDDLAVSPAAGRKAAGKAHAEQVETSGHQADASPRASRNTRGGQAPERPANAVALAPWAADALVQGAQAWQARAESAAAAPTGTGPQASAWSAVAPPAPPVIQAPPPRETVVVAPPVPAAPRFPHAWVGRFNDGAVLSGADATWVVRAGDVIEGQWRVDRVDERRMSLTYLPLNLPQQVVMR
jgi:hypothetical protein